MGKLLVGVSLAPPVPPFLYQERMELYMRLTFIQTQWLGNYFYFLPRPFA